MTKEKNILKSEVILICFSRTFQICASVPCKNEENIIHRSTRKEETKEQRSERRASSYPEKPDCHEKNNLRRPLFIPVMVQDKEENVTACSIHA
ncbi:ORC1-type DNA replication protein [Dirofilaria immitis]